MESGNSPRVQSSQRGPHGSLPAVVEAQRRVAWQAPVPSHTARAFAFAATLLEETPRAVVLDVGCGTGLSTAWLARMHPDAQVFGLDRSSARLGKVEGAVPENAALLRCDAGHFIALAAAARWPVTLLCFLYPNPYPKPAHLRRRWHAHPSFCAAMALNSRVMMRTNWGVYAEEFMWTLEAYGRSPDRRSVSGAPPVTAFERKYLASGHACEEVSCAAL